MKSVYDHQIKLAFINACHSEQMGNIFFNAGIPVVVCVSSGEEIDDDCCKEFSRQFYKSLLEGVTIKKAFTVAQNLITTIDKKYSPCCCTHTHSEDCWWYKLYKDD